ncbi:hypothetical protein [Nocardia cyriacigeorgica]|uniref:hypothetical protein n=1 Tax=Nocardia cyriacigeorgica TaxID=135487 RepID=UPI0013D53371|nr:hypothetical protein [Nocardia cyriacigeorgica]NEW29528.1 hypothetical protein [Nocardia cyriacigeorgica]
MRLEVSNRLTMLKGFVTARCEPEIESRYAWVWVYPLKDGRFDVSTVEIDKKFVDNDDDVGEDDISRRDLGIVHTIEEVDKLIEQLGVDPNDLDAPWHNGFPL